VPRAAFGPDSRRIKAGVFSHCFLLQDVVIPRRLETIGGQIFWGCNSLTDVAFEPGSGLSRIEAASFAKTVLRSTHRPSTISFVSGDASPESTNWLWRHGDDAGACLEQKAEPRRVDASTRAYVRTVKNGPIPVKLCRNDSSSAVAVKSYPPVDAAKQNLFMREVDALAYVGHPCAIPLFAHAFDGGPKLLTPFMASRSLRDAFSGRRRAWDGTAKSIAAVGTVRGMIEWHGAGIVQRELPPKMCSWTTRGGRASRPSGWIARGIQVTVLALRPSDCI
jgi:hypothetical protein